jgi:putative membrane protein
VGAAPHPGQPSGEPPAQVEDASRRTRLATERTYLAWWRTGLGCLAVGLGAGRLVPVLSHGTTWPYTVAGAGFAAVGVGCFLLAGLRQRQVEEAIARGEFAPPSDRLILFLTGAGVALGLLVLALVATDT